jgi:hypothetical protein
MTTSSTKEHLEHLLRELHRVGITPDVAQTNGNHLRIRWRADAPNGPVLRSIITSKTPSDHRSTLNCRARIRAYLREDGLLDAPRAEPKLLVKALAVPAPCEPEYVRFDRMERDIEALLDIVSDLTTKLIAQGIKLEDEPPPPPAPVQTKKAKKGEAPSWQHEFLLCVEYQPTPLPLITQRAGCSYGCASVRLTALKKAQLVEQVGRGLWRKKANGNGHASA